MLTKLRNRMAREESGFTLIELLVVMLILGLLAAIAIPSFFNQRNKAQDAEAKTHARTAQTAIESYATDNNNNYTNATEARLEAIEPTLADAASLTVQVGDNAATAGVTEQYTVTAGSDNAGQTFSISRQTGGLTDSDCVTRGRDGCPTDGNWANENDPAPPATP